MNAGVLRGARLLLVLSERLTHGLGGARLDSRQQERAAGRETTALVVRKLHGERQPQARG